MTGVATVAVLDVGKTNVKLSAFTGDGHVVESFSTPNPVRAGPPWQHNDLGGLGDWVFAGLSELCRRYRLAHVVAVGHGSGGVAVGTDPDGPDGGAVLPMIDYEQPLPEEIAESYAPLAGTFFDRGSAIMQAATHQARQMFWMARAEPGTFATARRYLGLPQYWAWRLSGVAVAEKSFLGAQSHLWNVAEHRFAPIVAGQGWSHLMPPFAHAGMVLGPLRPGLARRYGINPALLVHTGAHDSSTNFYRYQRAGLADITVVSTGTWIVALADGIPLGVLDEQRNMTLNCDMEGQALGGALTMGGREFSHVAGDQPKGAVADMALVARLAARGTFAVPAFGGDSGQFPGAAGKGRIAGPPPEGAAERLALAVLYVALLTQVCAASLGPRRKLVLDGSYLRDPAFADIVAALRPDALTLFNRESNGVASGAALLCSHHSQGLPVPLALDRARPAPDLKGLAAYQARWLELCNAPI